MAAMIKLIVVLACLLLTGCRAQQAGVLGMDPYVKDFVEALTKLVGILTVAFAGYGIFRGARAREEDLRWKKAEAAKNLFADIHAHPFAVQAIHMLDCHLAGHTYSAPEGTAACTDDVSLEKICLAIQRATNSRSPAEKYIYTCFDWLLYYLDRIAYWHSEKLIATQDIAPPLSPYTQLLSEHRDCFGPIIRGHAYRFLEEYLSASSIVGPSHGNDRTPPRT